MFVEGVVESELIGASEGGLDAIAENTQALGHKG